jgi:hypothetical protein
MFCRLKRRRNYSNGKTAFFIKLSVQCTAKGHGNHTPLLSSHHFFMLSHIEQVEGDCERGLRYMTKERKRIKDAGK